jgi:hypothetical protein
MGIAIPNRESGEGGEIMKVFLGGVAAAFLGVIGMFVFMGPFLHLLAGAIPLMLLVGGAMAAYLGYDEVKEKLPFSKKTEETSYGSSESSLKEAEGAHAVYDPEVDHLRLPAHLRGDLVVRNIEHLGRGPPMHIVPRMKRFQ